MVSECAGTVCGSEAGQHLFASMARSGLPNQSKSDRAGDLAAYSARLHALRAALHAAVRYSEAAARSSALFTALLTAWEEIKAAEEQRAAEEAEMFKTKTRKITSQEVSL